MRQREGQGQGDTGIAALASQIARIRQMTCNELHAEYRRLFGEDVRTRNVLFLRNRLLAKVQLNAIPENDRARLRVVRPEVMEEYDKRLNRRRRAVKLEPVRDAGASGVAMRDPRMPAPGTVLRKTHLGVEHRVRVLKDGFEWNGRKWRSLSRVAREITNTNWNGLLFFGLIERTKYPPKPKAKLVGWEDDA